MNSNTTNSRHPQRHSRRPLRGRSHGGPKTHASRPASSQSPALEPTPCDTEPVSFASLNLDPRLLEGIRDLGFSDTRPVQSAVIPLALAGHDLIACAQTGTGKTVAFVVPMVQWLLTTPRALVDGEAAAVQSRVLVLAPTRELAVQIEDEIHGLSYHTPITSAAVYGGVEMGMQERALRAGVDIIVATPGRLIDHMRQQNADLSAIQLLVLDEADRMMDMGFWPDVRKIADALPPTEARHTMFFSATMPEEVMRFASTLAPNAVFLLVGSHRGPPQTITHEAHVIDGHEKVKFLAKYLSRDRASAIVFVNTKIGTDRLARQLVAAGLRAVAIHADRSQKERTAAIEAFRAGRCKVLVATDVAARGLDIDDVALVVNYEVPHSLDAYVHRVGRTGRNEATGHALTLASPHERRDLEQIEQAFGLTLFTD